MGTDREQLKRFKEAAQGAGADMGKEEFARVVGGLTKPKPEAVDQEADSDQPADDQS